MDISIFLAQAVGIYLVIMGLMLFRGKQLVAIINTFHKDPTRRLSTGFVILIIGIIWVLQHNIWDGEHWQTVITIIGWITAIKGAAFVLAPESFFKSTLKSYNKSNILVIAGVVSLGVGAWLIKVGFGL